MYYWFAKEVFAKNLSSARLNSPVLWYFQNFQWPNTVQLPSARLMDSEVKINDPTLFTVFYKEITPKQFIQTLHIADLFTGKMEQADFSDLAFYNVQTNKFYEQVTALPQELLASYIIYANLETGIVFKELSTSWESFLSQRSCIARMAKRFIEDIKKGKFQELYN